MSEEQYTNISPTPQTDLDLNLMLTNSVWGRTEVPPELKARLTKYYAGVDEDGKPNITKESLWGLLGFYTRDMRLGNLGFFDNELQTCRYMIDLANDFLTVDMIEPFLVSLSRAATILETSQSKGGFLRRITNTLRQEHITQNIEPSKKSVLGGAKSDYRGGF